jgi:cytosine/adenosine deaminase-related metal-dependent hydrolase
VLERQAASARLAGVELGEPLLGRIEAGAPADVVVIDYDAPTPIDADNLASHWLYGISAADVRDVVVNGDVVVRNRRLTGADEAAERARSREAASRLWDRMDAIGEHPFEPVGAR